MSYLTRIRGSAISNPNQSSFTHISRAMPKTQWVIMSAFFKTPTPNTNPNSNTGNPTGIKGYTTRPYSWLVSPFEILFDVLWVQTGYLEWPGTSPTLPRDAGIKMRLDSHWPPVGNSSWKRTHKNNITIKSMKFPPKKRPNKKKTGSPVKWFNLAFCFSHRASHEPVGFMSLRDFPLKNGKGIS